MSEMVEVTIDSVRVSLLSPQRLVVLRDTNSDRYLPIWVGPYEAEAITVALQEIEMARPLTHDLLKNIFTTFGAQIKRVEIVALRGEVFYGNIVAISNGQVINVDARPSDAIALAVRVHVPIMVDPEVMASAISPEDDLRTQQPPQSTPRGESARPATSPAGSPVAPASLSPAASPEESGRLSIFEDFLSKLDGDKPPSEPDDPDKPETKK
jgi:bifunctional DNase/RNase